MTTKPALIMILSAVIVVWTLAACGETVDPPRPNPGRVTVALASPNPDDGGVRFTVRGGPIDSVTAGSYDVFHATVGAGVQRVIVIGALAPGPIAQLWLPDRNQLDSYELTVEEVAARGTFVSRPLADYTLTLIIP